MADEQARFADKAERGTISFPPFRADLVNEQLWRDDRLVPLKPKAFAVLKCLLEQPGQLLTQEELLARLWGEVHLSDGVLKTQMSEIRQALGDSAREPRFIQTVHRRGYRFIGHIAEAPGAPATSPAARHGATQPPRPAHFVGRDVELSLLAGRWSKALAGERQTVFVTGDGGVGKTALMHAFLRQLQQSEDDAVIAWGQCIGRYGSGEPYLPLIEALRRCCSEPSAERIAECLRRNAPSWLSVLSLQPLAPPGDANPVAQAPLPPGRMLRELVEALEMLGKQRSVVLLIEDLHWADNSTADLLAYLAQRSDPARLLVVGTYRPAEVLSGGAAELVSVLQARGRCSEVSVAQLSRQAVADYLELRFEQHRLPSAVPELIHRRTEGHALYMIGLVDGWLNHGLISTASGHCQLESNLDELARCVPDSFVRMVELDLRRLSPLERSVIEAASVVGNEFSTAAVAAALGADLVQVEEVCLQSSWRAGFFRRLGAAEWNDGTLAECFEFTHVLYQQVTYNQLGAARQAQWHQRIGERLELAHGKGAELIAPQLALHFHRGRDYRRAVHYLRRAGERALGQSAYHEGIAHLSRAIELSSLLPDTPERRSAELDLLLLVARPLGITKGYGASELEAIYARISQLSERGTSTRQRLLALAGIGAFHLVRNSSQTALSIGDEILQLAKDAGDAAARADAHALIGAACHFLGEHRKAEEHLLQAIAFHDANQGRSFMNITAIDNGIVARGMLAHSYWLLGYSLRGQEEVAISLQKVQDSRNAVATAHALSFASAVAILARDFAASRRYLAVLAGISGERGLEMYAATRLMHEGSILIEQGSPEQGIESIERGWRAYAATGTEAYASYWSCCLARAHRSVGRSEAALQILNRALSVDRSRRDLLWESELLRLRGEILVESEQPNSTALEDASSGNHLDLAGEDCLLRALEIARHQSAQILELRAAMSLSRHWWSRAQREQARGLLAKVCEHFDGAEVEPDYVAAKQLLSELAQPQGTTPGNDESSAVCPATAPSSN